MDESEGVCGTAVPDYVVARLFSAAPLDAFRSRLPPLMAQLATIDCASCLGWRDKYRAEAPLTAGDLSSTGLLALTNARHTFAALCLRHDGMYGGVVRFDHDFHGDTYGVSKLAAKGLEDRWTMSGLYRLEIIFPWLSFSSWTAGERDELFDAVESLFKLPGVVHGYVARQDARWALTGRSDVEQRRRSMATYFWGDWKGLYKAHLAGIFRLTYLTGSVAERVGRARLPDHWAVSRLPEGGVILRTRDIGAPSEPDAGPLEVSISSVMPPTGNPDALPAPVRRQILLSGGQVAQLGGVSTLKHCLDGVEVREEGRGFVRICRLETRKLDNWDLLQLFWPLRPGYLVRWSLPDSPGDVVEVPVSLDEGGVTPPLVEIHSVAHRPARDEHVTMEWWLSKSLSGTRNRQLIEVARAWCRDGDGELASLQGHGKRFALNVKGVDWSAASLAQLALGAQGALGPGERLLIVIGGMDDRRRRAEELVFRGGGAVTRL